MVVLAFVGGALADYFDKRKMLRLTESRTGGDLRDSLDQLAACPTPGLGVVRLLSPSMPDLLRSSDRRSNHLFRRSFRRS